MKHLLKITIIAFLLSACNVDGNLDMSKVKDPEKDVLKIYPGFKIESITKEDLNYDDKMDVYITGYNSQDEWLEAYFIHNDDENTYKHVHADDFWENYEEYEERFSSVEQYFTDVDMESVLEDITYADITGDGIDDAISISYYSSEGYQSIDATFFTGTEDGFRYTGLAEVHYPAEYDNFDAYKTVVAKDRYFTIELGDMEPYWDRFITFKYDDEEEAILLHKDGGTIIGSDGHLVREQVIDEETFGIVYFEEFTPFGDNLFSLKTEVTVTNTREFLNALGNNRIIYLEEGTYALDDFEMLPEAAQEAYQDADDWSTFYTTDFYNYTCGNKEYGGALELELQNLKNVDIIGLGNVDLVVRDEMSNVLKFDNCESMQINNLYMVHEVGGVCGADVVDLQFCYDLNFDKCVFDGSGELGVYSNGSYNMNFNNCDFTNCTSGAVEFNESDAVFQSCSFSNNEIWFSLVRAYGYSSLEFNACDFSNNDDQRIEEGDQESYLFHAEGDSYIYLDGDCTVGDNAVSNILNDADFVEIE